MQLVILSNVPLTIPLADIEGALRNHHIECNHLDRSGTNIFVEVFITLSQRLLFLVAIKKNYKNLMFEYFSRIALKINPLT